jgi:hypothetical protein
MRLKSWQDWLGSGDRRGHRVSEAIHFPQAAKAALADTRLQSALKHLKEGFQVKRADALAGFSTWRACAKRRGQSARMRSRIWMSCWCSSRRA